LTNTSSIGLHPYEDAFKYHASPATQRCHTWNRSLLALPLWNHHKHTAHTSMICAGRSYLVSHSLLHSLVVTMLYICIARKCIYICQH